MNIKTKAEIAALLLLDDTDAYFSDEAEGEVLIDPSLFATRASFIDYLLALSEADYAAIDGALSFFGSEDSAKDLVTLYFW